MCRTEILIRFLSAAMPGNGLRTAVRPARLSVPPKPDCRRVGLSAGAAGGGKYKKRPADGTVRGYRLCPPSRVSGRPWAALNSLAFVRKGKCRPVLLPKVTHVF